MSTILITGVNGFVGEHLAHELSDAGHTLVGAGIQGSLSQRLSSIVSQYIQCDLTIDAQIDALPLNSIDGVIHLAGLAAVGPSFDQPQTYMQVNTGVLFGLFEGFMRAGTRRPRVIAVSSAAVYGRSTEAITETSPTTVDSPYTASKLASELVVQHYRTRGFHDSIIVRPFNHIGPHQGPGFLVPDIALQLKDAQPNQKILTGNITTARDYTDVRDVVRAYRLLLEADTPQYEVYNVCSNNPVTGEHMLKQLQQAMQREDVTITTDPARIRPNDNPMVQGSFERLAQEVNWQPTIPLKQTIHDFVAAI